MDIFEEHFNMLKKNEEVFNKFSTQVYKGIKIPNKLQNDFLKTGKDLLPEDKTKEFREVRSIHYHNVITKKLKEYNFPEWIVCLNEKVLLDYTIPIFSRVLAEYPMLCGMNSEWQILYEITKIDWVFWKTHRTWKMFFDEIIEEVILSKEQGGLITPISEEYLYKFKNFREYKLRY